MDCSKTLLKVAESKKIYSSLEKVAMGQDELSMENIGKYEFVISATMINNDGWDEKVFM